MNARSNKLQGFLLRRLPLSNGTVEGQRLGGVGSRFDFVVPSAVFTEHGLLLLANPGQLCFVARNICEVIARLVIADLHQIGSITGKRQLLVDACQATLGRFDLSPKLYFLFQQLLNTLLTQLDMLVNVHGGLEPPGEFLKLGLGSLKGFCLANSPGDSGDFHKQQQKGHGWWWCRPTGNSLALRYGKGCLNPSRCPLD